MTRLMPLLLVVMVLSGCRARGEVPMNRPSGGQSVQREADALGARVAAVQAATTPAAEADALRRLREYETDHGLTYAIRTFRASDNVPVDDPSTRPDRVRAEVTIFRGRETIHSFQFVPRDNRNLALLGE